MKRCLHKTESPCAGTNPVPTRKITSLAGFVLLILPKCPACLVSYSSAMTLCGTTTLHTYVTRETDIKAYIGLVLGLLIVGSILYAYFRGRSVQLALAIAVCGQILLGVSVLRDQSFSYYYTGALLLIGATFLFGSSFHWKKIKKYPLEQRNTTSIPGSQSVNLS